MINIYERKYWLLFVCSVLVVVIAVGRMGLAASGERGLKIVCTDSAEHMTRSLLDVFSEMTKKDGGQPGEQFTTKGSKNAAIHRFARGHDLMLCWGPVGGKLPRRTRYLWNKHAPEEHIVGAMAVALVVHADNSVDSLSLSQVRSIFSGQTGNWAAVGGEDRPIERHGPPHEKPFMRIYRDRCQPMGKDDLNRKGNSEGVLSAVVADPYAIGIVDAARTISTGRSARMISIDGVRVNARSVGSGRYPLGERLFLYVSPEPSQTARDFVQCVMSDQHNKLLRDHGLVPAFRATESSVVGGFRSLYAADLKRVKKTSEHSDDLELANELIDSARTMEVGAETARAMGKAAYGLASDVPGGETTAFRAIYLVADRGEGDQLTFARRRLELYSRAYEAKSDGVTANNLVGALMFAARAATRAHRHVIAADMWQRACNLASEYDLFEAGELERGLAAFESRAQTQKQIQPLYDLHGFENEADRRKLLHALLIELDNPAAAEQVLTDTDDESFITNIPLAKKPVEEVAEQTALKLAEWYVGLIPEASTGGRELLVRRAKDYYHRFFRLHEDRDDELARRAALGLEKIDGRVPPPDRDTDHGNSDRLGYELREIMSDMRLAEYVARHPNIRRLGGDKIGSIRQVSDLEPLKHLKRLRYLELPDAGKIKDLSPLARLPRLKTLKITGLEVEDLSGLSGVESLESLYIGGAKRLKDLGTLEQMQELRTLKVRNCPQVSDISPLQELDKLRKLDLSGCHSLRDLKPVEKLDENLQELILRECRELKDVYPISKCTALKRLDVRRCPQVPQSDVEWLGRQIPDCRLRF